MDQSRRRIKIDPNAPDKTLMELLEGPNHGAAQNEVDDKVYFYATLFNFIRWRLVSSYGAPRPQIYDEENRQL
jgi:hypothetical protein